MAYEMIRSNSEPLEVTERSDNQRHLSGYAVVYYDGTEKTEYPMGDFVERIKREDFEPCLSGKNVVALRLNHSKDFELDSTKDTLQLRSDSKGVFFSSPYDAANPDYQKVYSAFKKNRIRGCSFGFRGGHRFEMADGKCIGWLKPSQLNEVSIIGANSVDRPAYSGTECSYRTAEDEYQEYAAAMEETQKRIESLKNLG